MKTLTNSSALVKFALILICICFKFAALAKKNETALFLNQIIKHRTGKIVYQEYVETDLKDFRKTLQNGKQMSRPDY